MPNYSTYDKHLQVAADPKTGEIVTLNDSRHDWRGKRMGSIRLAKLYDLAHYPPYAERARTCATWLQYQVTIDGSRYLSGANFCDLRLCPMCISRRAKRSAYRLSQVLDLVEQRHGAMYLFLTLTLRNVTGDQLGDGISQLTDGWYRLMLHRQIQRSVKGWFRAIEITRNPKTGEYHPHIHAILAVEPAYFGRRGGLYISHAEWLRRWKLALRVDYDPSVRIQTVKAKGEVAGGRAAALEAAKYAVKDDDYIDKRIPDDVAAAIVRDYTEALHRRRLTAFGGWLKEAARALDADDLDTGDLVHVDDDGIRDDVAELIETYNWHFGAGDYVLTRRQVNPLFLKREGLIV